MVRKDSEIAQKEDELRDRENQIMRREFLIKEYTDKLAKYRSQNDDLKAHLRDVAIKHRNLCSYLQSRVTEH